MKYCEGCEKSEEELMQEHNCTEEELDEWSVSSKNGDWYCNEDCFRDSH